MTEAKPIEWATVNGKAWLRTYVYVEADRTVRTRDAVPGDVFAAGFVPASDLSDSQLEWTRDRESIRALSTNRYNSLCEATATLDRERAEWAKEREGLERFRAAIEKINDIRNSIVGLQKLNWSEHIYPLVAALNEAGMVGMEYPEARGHFVSLLERANRGDEIEARLTAAESRAASAERERSELYAQINEIDATIEPFRNPTLEGQLACIRRMVRDLTAQGRELALLRPVVSAAERYRCAWEGPGTCDNERRALWLALDALATPPAVKELADVAPTVKDPEPPQRPTRLTPHDQFNLDLACRPLVDAFGWGVFQVGSSLRRGTYNDVDVRCMLEDGEFAQFFRGKPDRLRILNAAVTLWLGRATGLPIDFQFQDTTAANADFNGPRSALGVTPSKPRLIASDSEKDPVQRLENLMDGLSDAEQRAKLIAAQRAAVTVSEKQLNADVDADRKHSSES